MRVGRLGRKAFATSILISFVIIMLLMLIRAPIGLAMTFIYINFAWLVLIYIGRLHDAGHSGWWTLLVLPTSGLGLLILALFPGNKGANKYGEVPTSEISHLLHFWRAEKML